jgi:hypothetical protein
LPVQWVYDMAMRFTIVAEPDTAFAPARYDDIDFSPPETARDEAAKGLAWRSDHGRGGTEVGVARARDISRGANLSPETVRRMSSYFARHEVDKDGAGWTPDQDGFPSAGRIAWALWGGDPGKAWAGKVTQQMDSRDKNAQLTVEETMELAEAPLDAVESEQGEKIADLDEEVGTDDDALRYLLVVEGVETGDGRVIDENALSWRELPLPFMATDTTAPGHDGAKLVGQIVKIERDGSSVYGDVMLIDSDDADVLRLQRLIRDGDMRGVSVDLDKVDGQLEIVTDDVSEIVKEVEDELDDDTQVVVEELENVTTVPLNDPTMRITAARIMGATAVPFPAFAEAQQIVATLLAGATRIETEQPTHAPIQAPVHPPASFFADPALTGPTPLTVTDDGQIFGHLALWASCHRGFDVCTPPPRAPGGDYTHFHTGEIITDTGERLSVGNVTVDAGHASLSDDSRLAKEHYDHTGWIGAEIRCGEDQHGIWMAGALRSDLAAERVRALMACDVSGDWRAIDGTLRLIGIASVPVPGFVKQRVASGAPLALVASIPVCSADLDPEHDAVADFIAASIGRDRATKMGQRDALALGVGRHPLQVRQALRARVAAPIVEGVR